MEVAQCRSYEKENAWLQECIHEELARGEVWQRQYEALLECQTQLCSLLQAKSLEPLEKKSRVWQKELEDVQEARQECWSWRCRCQRRIHKQEKENRRMAESVTELENKVLKQRQKEKSGKDLQREMRVEGSRLKRHLSVWEVECRAESERIRERQQQLEKRRATLQELSLRSQELHRNKTPWEDGTMEAQLEADPFQKKAFLGQARTPLLWEEQAPDWMKVPGPHIRPLLSSRKRFLCQELEGIRSKEQLPSRCFVSPAALWTAWCFLWALAKAPFLLFLLMVVFHVLYSCCFGCTCSRLASAPFQPKDLLLYMHEALMRL